MNYLKQNGKYKNMVVVEFIEDLPQPIGDIITIPSNTTLMFPAGLDIGAFRLVCEHNVVLIGASPEVSLLTNSLANQPLISSTGTLKLRHISLSVQGLNASVFDLNGVSEPLSTVDWLEVVIKNSQVGLAQNYQNFIAQFSSFYNSSGLVFDGSFGSIVFDTSIFIGATSTYISTLPTTTLNRRIRLENCPLDVPIGKTGLDISTSSTISTESYVVKYCNFSGLGTYLAGVQAEDNKSLFIDNKGVTNSASLTEYYDLVNTTPTVIPATNTFVKANLTTSAGAYSQKFLLSDNRATYTGVITKYFKVSVNFSATAGNNHIIVGNIAKNGVLLPSSQSRATTSGTNRAENIKSQTIVSLSYNDYIELWVTNTSNTTSVVVSDLNVIVEALN